MRHALALLLLLPLALVAESGSLLLLVTLGGPLHGTELIALGGLHLFSAVVAGEALRLRYQDTDPGQAGAWRLGLGLSLLLPGFGVLVTAVLVIRTPRTVRVKVDDFVSPMEDRRRQAEAERAAEANQSKVDVNVETIGDALNDDDKVKRLGAVEALRALENKQAVAMLDQSLDNSVFEVRYHAVEALAGIGKKHSERVAAATAVAERQGTPEAFRALGEVYFDYATLEMEEPAIQQHLYRHALENLRRGIHPGRPGAPEVLQKIGMAQEGLGELEAARQSFRAVLEQRPESFEALLGLARVQYLSGEFAELRETCRRLLELPAGDPQVSPVLLLWAEGLAAAGAAGPERGA